MVPHSPACPGESVPPVVITMAVVTTTMMMLFTTIMMICTTKDLAEMVDNAGTNGISKNIDCRAESEEKNIILGSKNIYHHPQPGCKHYDDSY